MSDESRKTDFLSVQGMKTGNGVANGFVNFFKQGQLHFK